MESRTTPAITAAANALELERKNATAYVFTCVQHQKINPATFASLLDRVSNAAVALHIAKAVPVGTRGAELTAEELKALRSKSEDL